MAQRLTGLEDALAGLAYAHTVADYDGRPLAIYEDFGGRSLTHLLVTRVFDLRTHSRQPTEPQNLVGQVLR